MDDLISRKALLAEYDRVHIGEPGKARKLIEDAPRVDAVEVVRCKDCEYGIDEEHEGIFSCHASPWGMGGYNKADDFCSFGERRTE